MAVLIMTQKDEELLLKDLCARLTCGVKVLYEGQVKEVQYIEPLYNELKLLENSNYTIGIEEIKPYLRPMSSMTEEEKRQYMGFIAYSGNPNGSANFVDWLNEHHFDYRTTYDENKEKWVSMIEKGLAIEVTEENNPYKI